jgi:hypothetical protein
MINKTEVNAFKLAPGVAKVGDEVEYTYAKEAPLLRIVESIKNSGKNIETIYFTDGSAIDFRAILLGRASGWVTERS